jgi:hypothetical protein
MSVQSENAIIFILLVLGCALVGMGTNGCVGFGLFAVAVAVIGKVEMHGKVDDEEDES